MNANAVPLPSFIFRVTRSSLQKSGPVRVTCEPNPPIRFFPISFPLCVE